MKTFIYTIVKTTQQSMGGRKQTAWIYRMKNNRPIYVCDTTWNTAGYYGEETEVQRELVREGFLAKKYMGYYNAFEHKQHVIYRVG